MKKHIKQSKKLRDQNRTTDYDGEASPYNLFMKEVTRDGSGTTEYKEFPEANPDVLAESDSLYYVPEDDTKETKFQAIQETFADLTGQQQEIIKYIQKGFELDEIATFLGVSKGSVYTQLGRARTKIKKKYKKLL